MTEEPKKQPAKGIMKCPTCKTPRLEPREIARGLGADSCPQCSGNFLVFETYLTWQESQPAPTKQPEIGTPDPNQTPEAAGPKLCPYCGRFMTRFRIALDIPFHIDRCGGCGGLWFERGEWDQCQTRGIHTRLNTFFNDSWQNRLRQEEAKFQQEDRYRALLGPEAYERVKAFKAWAEQHDKKSVLFAYLESKDVSEPPSRR